MQIHSGPLARVACPDSSVVEHLHGKQAVVGSIPILGRTYAARCLNSYFVTERGI